MDNVNRLSITQTVARQTPKNEFGQVLKNTVTNGVKLAGQIVGGIAGMPIVSAAVSSVTALAGGSSAGGSVAGGTRTVSSAATGVVTLAGGAPTNGGVTGTATVGTTIAGGSGAMGAEPVATGAEPQNFDAYLSQMRAESDRSMMMQMQMQQESRDYNTLSNVIKVRHDSAKAAINNIR